MIELNRASILVFLLLINAANFLITVQTQQTNEFECSSQMYKRLIVELEKDVTENWLYKDLYKTPQDVGISPDVIQTNAIANFGDEKRLKKILINAMTGNNVELAIIGGSISRGAPFSERGQGFRVYFNQIVHWWSETFEKITGSKLNAKSISIGGIGTDYYSYCLSSHLPEDDKPKLFLWELSANDRGRYDDKQYPKSQPLEQLTRNILNRKSKPTLLYANFFRGNDYIEGICRNFEDEGGQRMAQHYKITSLSWRNFVCWRMQQRESQQFLFRNIFSSDSLHPSIMGHAQMSYLIIHYLKTSFVRMLRNHACRVPSFELFQQQTYNQGDMLLSAVIYHETALQTPLCYTYFANDNIQPNNTLTDVRITRQDDFHYNIYKKFKIRGDQLAGLQTNISEQLLQYELFLPRNCKRMVIITHSHTGNAQVWVDKSPPVIIDTSDYHMGTKIEIITTNLIEGQHYLNVFSLPGGFAISGIAVV